FGLCSLVHFLHDNLVTQDFQLANGLPCHMSSLALFVIMRTKLNIGLLVLKEMVTNRQNSMSHRYCRSIGAPSGSDAMIQAGKIRVFATGSCSGRFDQGGS